MDAGPCLATDHVMKVFCDVIGSQEPTENNLDGQLWYLIGQLKFDGVYGDNYTQTRRGIWAFRLTNLQVREIS